MKETVAERTKRARIACGFTQDELARSAGVTRDVIAMIETGRTKRPRQLEKIAEALNVSPAWLAFGDELIDELSEEDLRRAARLKSLPDGVRIAIEQMIDAAVKKD